MKTISIEEIKQTEIELLKKIDMVCKENGLHYYLHAGTLLGAIRHKGFIPWDDDIDIVMFREDYDKFRDITTKIDCGFNFVCFENNKDYVYAFGKVCDRCSTLIENNYKDVGMGVYIDIFPLDNLPDDEKRAYKHIKKCFRTRLMADMSSQIKYHSPQTGGFGKKLLKPFAYFYAKLRGKDFLIKKLDRLSRKYYDGSKSKNVSICLDPNYIKIYKRAWYNKQVQVDFEGEKFYAPEEWDKVLTCMYSDYMQLPPVEQQVTHHNFVVYKNN